MQSLKEYERTLNLVYCTLRKMKIGVDKPICEIVDELKIKRDISVSERPVYDGIIAFLEKID